MTGFGGSGERDSFGRSGVSLFETVEDYNTAAVA